VQVNKRRVKLAFFARLPAVEKAENPPKKSLLFYKARIETFSQADLKLSTGL
jgi:hypothetical protein